MTDEVPPIVFCETCGMDTIPLKSGRCGFCDLQLIGKEPAPVELAAHGTEARYRTGCGCEPCKAASASARAARRIAHRTPAWRLRRMERLGLTDGNGGR